MKRETVWLPRGEPLLQPPETWMTGVAITTIDGKYAFSGFCDCKDFFERVLYPEVATIVTYRNLSQSSQQSVHLHLQAKDFQLWRQVCRPDSRWEKCFSWHEASWICQGSDESSSWHWNWDIFEMQSDDRELEVRFMPRIHVSRTKIKLYGYYGYCLQVMRHIYVWSGGNCCIYRIWDATKECDSRNYGNSMQK